MEGNKGCYTFNFNGCCGSGNNSASTNDGTPVGTVIAYMGTKAPAHYLVCDGTVLNIADYAQLGRQIQDEFGSVSYFGGDGTTTFAIPDLRNEFLRGYHGNAVITQSDEIGKHQEATQHLYSVMTGDSNALHHYYGNYSEVSEEEREHIYTHPTQMDSTIDSMTKGASNVKTAVYDSNGGTAKFTSRPTNVAVLYCIKFE